MRQRLMKLQPLQWFIAVARSVLRFVQKPLYHLGFTIVLVSTILSSGVLLLAATSAQAGSLSLAGVVEQTVRADTPGNNVPNQLPPNLAKRLRQALSKQTKISAAKLKVVEATPKTWTNGCLNLDRSDEICTQALVEGWRVVFSNGSQRWTYRTDRQGRLYRLEP
jgi:hypothetical protein